MKSNLAKKILSISVVSIVIALVIVTIVLALVPKRLDNPIMSGYNSIAVYKNDVNQTYYYNANATDEDSIKENEIFKKIEQLHEESLKDSLLSTLFQGASNFDLKVESKYYSNAITQAQNESDIVLVFTYATTTKTLEINGEEYKHTTALSSTSVTFDRVVMAIKSSDSYEECTIYLADRSSNNTDYQVKFLAHQSALMEYLESLSFPIVA